MSLSGQPFPNKETLIVQVAQIYSKADVLREAARRNGRGGHALDLLEIMHLCDQLKKDISEVVPDLSTTP